VYRSTSASGAYSQVANTTSTSYTNTALSAGTTYYYKVSAYTGAGEGSQSSYVSAITAPAAPTGVTATAPSSSSAAVSWSAVSGAAGYYVYRGATASGTYSKVANVTTASYTDTELSSGTIYYYKVSAYTDGWESSQSSYVSVTPPFVVPGIPTNVTATARSKTTIRVSWSAVAGATKYYVYRNNTSDGEYGYICGNTTSTSFISDGLSEGATYYYKVSASNNAGTSSLSAYASATAGIITDILTDPRDNDRTYKTVVIGGKTWMAEDLKFETGSGSSCYGGTAANCERYGRQYTWDMARVACPSGWHLPSSQEWTDLAREAISVAELKSTNVNSNDKFNEVNGTNDFGFSASNNPVEKNPFSPAGGYWWADSTTASSMPCYMFISYRNADNSMDVGCGGSYDNTKDWQLLVRCVKND
jgi:uncharacterized protein (TIGR02145 family)